MKLAHRLALARCDTVPAGWLTNDQLARKEGFSSADSARLLIRDALRAGLIERRDFRVIWGGLSRLRPHYRYVK